MAHEDDVERLFSWLKTPDLRYREFAADRDLADAVATWPALRRTAAERREPGAVEAEPLPPEHPVAPSEPPEPGHHEPVLPRTEPPPLHGAPEPPAVGAFRGFDEEPPPPPAAEGESPPGRSLNEVFSRLSRAAGHYHEERQENPPPPGSRPVFRRLR